MCKKSMQEGEIKDRLERGDLKILRLCPASNSLWTLLRLPSPRYLTNNNAAADAAPSLPHPRPRPRWCLPGTSAKRNGNKLLQSHTQ